MPVLDLHGEIMAKIHRTKVLIKTKMVLLKIERKNKDMIKKETLKVFFMNSYQKMQSMPLTDSSVLPATTTVTLLMVRH